MTDLPNIDQRHVGRAASVKTKRDHVAVRFFYMTPFAATLSNLVVAVVPLVAGYCLISDLIFAYFWGSGVSPYPHAQKYIPVLYNLYSGIGDLLLSIFYVIVYDSQSPSRFQNGVLLAISSVGSFAILNFIAKLAQAYDIAPMLFKPLLQIPMTVRFYPDKVKIGWKSYELDPVRGFFTDTPLRHRQLLNTSSAMHRSASIFLQYGASHLKIVTIFGIEKAERVQAVLLYVLSCFKPV